MKKIIFVFISLILLCGCKYKENKLSNNIKKTKDKKTIETKVMPKLFYSTVNYVNHDDIVSIKEEYYDSKKENNLSKETYIEEVVPEKTIVNISDTSSDKEEPVLEIKENTSINEEKVVEEIKNKEEKKNIPEKEIENKKEKENIPEKEIVKNEIKEEVKEEVKDDYSNIYYSVSGKKLNSNNVKVIDVSYYQKNIDWNKFKKESDCYGVILRLGFYDTLDSSFSRNLSELKRLNIPYGIYLFSYSTTKKAAEKESLFTNKMISKFDIKPSLGIYYDIESWSTKTLNSNNISKNMYDKIINLYINKVSNYVNYKYKVRVYSGRWYAMNRLGVLSKKYVDWVAEYNKKCNYDGNYSMWQYTSKGKVPGINGYVDISYLY